MCCAAHQRVYRVSVADWWSSLNPSLAVALVVAVLTLLLHPAIRRNLGTMSERRKPARPAVTE